MARGRVLCAVTIHWRIAMSAETRTDRSGVIYVLGMMPDGKISKFATFEEYERSYTAALIVSEQGQYHV
jgi:hypothetical protein